VLAWCQTIEAFDEREQAGMVALFNEDRAPPLLDCDVVHIRLNGLRLRRPRQRGGCWLACHLWEQLELDEFWAPRLPPSRQGKRWLGHALAGARAGWGTRWLGHALAERAEDAGHLPIDRSRQRMAAAPAMV
jgi:hypothetical protein